MTLMTRSLVVAGLGALAALAAAGAYYTEATRVRGSRELRADRLFAAAQRAPARARSARGAPALADRPSRAGAGDLDARRRPQPLGPSTTAGPTATTRPLCARWPSAGTTSCSLPSIRAALMTVDKPPLAFWVQALSARVFGFNSWSILVPQALMGMATVVLTTTSCGGASGGSRLRRRVDARDHADHGRDLAPQQPGRAADPLLRRGAVVRGARYRGRAHQVDRLVGRAGRSGFETKMGVALMVVPGYRARLAVGAPRGPAEAHRATAAPAARRCSWSGLRGLLLCPHAGGGPAMDLRHGGQQRLVPDVRVQRARPDRRAVRRPLGGVGAGGGGGGGTASVRRADGRVPPDRLCARGPGRLATRFCRGGSHSAVGDDPDAPLDPRTGWLLLSAALLDRSRLSASPRDLPPVLRLDARPVRGGPDRCRGRPDAPGARWRSAVGAAGSSDRSRSRRGGHRVVVLRPSDRSDSIVGDPAR